MGHIATVLEVKILKIVLISKKEHYDKVLYIYNAMSEVIKNHS